MEILTPVNVKSRQELNIRTGDQVRVSQKIQEKDGKVRIQIFEGLVLARKHGKEPGATFTVRKTSGGVGVEKIFPLYSPAIDKIEIVRRSRLRRSKAYYLRDKVARTIRQKLKRMVAFERTSVSELAEAKKVEEAKTKAEEAEKLKAEKEAAEVKKAEEQAAAKVEENTEVKTEASAEAKESAEVSTPETTNEANEKKVVAENQDTNTKTEEAPKVCPIPETEETPKAQETTDTSESSDEQKKSE